MIKVEEKVFEWLDLKEYTPDPKRTVIFLHKYGAALLSPRNISNIGGYVNYKGDIYFDKISFINSNIDIGQFTHFCYLPYVPEEICSRR